MTPRKSTTAKTNSLAGIINFDKPSGCTSHDVVAYVRSLLPGRTKVGHGGTLDPLATGVLPICVGGTTRLSRYFQRERKAYLVTALLDVRSDTADIEGKTLEQFAPPSFELGADEFEGVLERFRGDILQRPPVYSAIRIGGTRAYEMARKGIAVEMPERSVTVFELELLDYAWPRMTLRIVCSSGTYVRSLVEDIGREFGLGGCVEQLRREAVGGLLATEGRRPTDLAGAALRDDFPAMFSSVRDVFTTIAPVQVKSQDVPGVRNGRVLTDEQIVPLSETRGTRISVFDETGTFLAMYRRSNARENWRAETVLG